MRQRHQARAARRVARRLAKATATPPPTIVLGGTARPQPVPAFDLCDVVVASDESERRAAAPAGSAFADRRVARAVPPVSETLWRTADVGGCFADAPRPARRPGSGHIDGSGAYPAHVDTYLNLGTDVDYRWVGQSMDRRPEHAPRGPGRSTHPGQVSTETV